MLTRTNKGRPFLYIGTIILGLLFALPFLYTIYTSVIPMRHVNTLTSPANWTFENFKVFFTNDAYNVPRWFLNTVIMTGAVVAGIFVGQVVRRYARHRHHRSARRHLDRLERQRAHGIGEGA